MISVRTTWEETAERFRKATDKLGKRIDDGIFETVVALNILGFTTFQSCEGHLDHGAAYPWVIVVDTEIDRLVQRHWQVVCELKEQAEHLQTCDAYDRYFIANNQLDMVVACYEQECPLYRRLTTVLDTFYAHSINPSPTRLLIKRMRSSGFYRIQPGMADGDEDVPNYFKAAYLERGQAEMAAFTAFLKQQML